jgi:DNA primase
MNVEELLIKKSLDFQPRGADYLLKCISPDHDDSSPSMRVDKITGIFHCLSCGFKGNIFSHFKAKSNPFEIRKELLKQKINNKLAESIGLVKPSGSVDYEGSWRGISAETYKKFGAFQNAASEYIGRIVFPITDASGRYVAFVGRHTNMMHNPKYMIYPAKAKMPLFPIVTPIEGKVILVEGIFDMLNLHDKGLTNAICTFGTRTMTAEKLGLLKMQGVDTIDIMFDADTAGQSAVATVKELADEVELMYRNVELKENDPGSLSEAAIIKLKRSLYG